MGKDKKLVKQNKIKRQGMSDKTFDALVMGIMIVFLIIVLYPLIYVVSSSFSSGTAVTTGRVLLWPVDFSIEGYKFVFSNKQIWTGYGNTIVYTLGSTIIGLISVVMTAYPLSRKNFQWRNFYAWYFIIPMYIGGGLIPTYIWMTQLHLVDTRTFMIISGAVGMSNVILVRTFFQSSVPVELLESAKMDGISDMGYLFKIVLPLSKAVISVVSLYLIVGEWNSYFTGMIYLRDETKWPLQLVLRQILATSTMNSTQVQDANLLAEMSARADVMKYALIVVSAAPMIILYPFVQKFFEKGVMIGSLKG
ncbi:MAG: carbohydrate ABC transporter permease [Tyzzerella sp.]|nr:carbohydrate ABC transporter permease [Tyzzerella sp.]